MDSNTFESYESHVIPMGSYSLDIAILSDIKKYDPKYESKAQVLIKRLSLIGSVHGGASECLPCEDGYINTGKQSYCERCPPGMVPNSDKTECVFCPVDTIKPETEGTCE